MLIDKIREIEKLRRGIEEAEGDYIAVGARNSLSLVATAMAQALIAVDDVLKEWEKPIGRDYTWHTTCAEEIRKAIESTVKEQDNVK